MQRHVEAVARHKRRIYWPRSVPQPAPSVAIRERSSIDKAAQHREVWGVHPPSVCPGGTPARGTAGAALVKLIHILPAGADCGVRSMDQLIKPRGGREMVTL